jgi:glycine/D-amino acid oxidase-like deaminating enzyme
MTTYDVAVVGGGLLGTATAYELAGLGARTVLLERNTLGAAASGQNAGTLNLIHEKTRRFDDLGFRLRALDRWRALGRELDAPLGEQVGQGTLLVAETPAEAEAMERLAAGYRSAGLALECIDGPALQHHAPYLSPEIHAALFCPLGGHADPALATSAFAAAATRRGACIRQGCPVTALAPDGQGWGLTTLEGRVLASYLVVAAGPWSMALLAPFGIEIPLRIQFFQACTTVTAAHFLPHGIRRMAGSLTLKQRPDGRCVLGGGWTGHSYFPGPGTLRPETLEANCAVAARIVPQFARLETDDAWGSYDGSSIDGQPILDEAPGYPGLFVSTGANEGFCHGPILATLTAQRVMGLALAEDIGAFAVTRFQRAA